MKSLYLIVGMVVAICLVSSCGKDTRKERNGKSDNEIIDPLWERTDNFEKDTIYVCRVPLDKSLNPPLAYKDAIKELEKDLQGFYHVFIVYKESNKDNVLSFDQKSATPLGIIYGDATNWGEIYNEDDSGRECTIVDKGSADFTNKIEKLNLYINNMITEKKYDVTSGKFIKQIPFLKLFYKNIDSDGENCDTAVSKALLQINIKFAPINDYRKLNDLLSNPNNLNKIIELFKGNP